MWISSKPTDTSCSYQPPLSQTKVQLGTCDPPSDVNTTDQAWKNFITTLVKHVGTKITYFELWNTPQDTTQWTGTPAQLVTMAKDARTIILAHNPKAKILTPPSGSYKVTNNPCFGSNQLDKFFAAGGAKYVDIVSFHGYYGNPPQPEQAVSVINCFKQEMSKYGLSAKPLWNTEGSWGANTLIGNNLTTEIGWVARSLLIQLSMGVQRYHWYDYDNPNWGTLWNNSLLPPGVAYEQVYNWLVGATMTRPCAATTGTSTWTCPITRTSPYKAMAVWNTAGSTLYTVPSGFTRYRDLTGKITATSAGAKIMIGASPLLLEN